MEYSDYFSMIQQSSLREFTNLLHAIAPPDPTNHPPLSDNKTDYQSLKPEYNVCSMDLSDIEDLFDIVKTNMQALRTARLGSTSSLDLSNDETVHLCFCSIKDYLSNIIHLMWRQPFDADGTQTATTRRKGEKLDEDGNVVGYDYDPDYDDGPDGGPDSNSNSNSFQHSSSSSSSSSNSNSNSNSDSNRRPAPVYGNNYTLSFDDGVDPTAASLVYLDSLFNSVPSESEPDGVSDTSLSRSSVEHAAGDMLHPELSPKNSASALLAEPLLHVSVGHNALPSTRYDRTTRPKSQFTDFIVKAVALLNAGHSVAQLSDLTKSLDIPPKIAPPVDAASFLRKMNNSIAHHVLVINSSAWSPHSIVRRRYGDQIPSYITASPIASILKARQSLRDSSVLRFKTARQKRVIIGRAQEVDRWDLRARQAAQHQAMKALGQPVTTPLRVPPRPSRQFLASKGITASKSKLHHRLQNSHVHPRSPASAYANKPAAFLLTDGKAVLDSGSSRHFCTERMYQQLTKKRSIPTSVTMANGHTEIISKGGDFHLPLADCSGSSIGFLPLLRVNVLRGSTFNLLSLHQLVAEGAHFEHSDPDVSYMYYAGHCFPLEVDDNLIIIDLETPLRAQSLHATTIAGAAIDSFATPASTDEDTSFDVGDMFSDVPVSTNSHPIAAAAVAPDSTSVTPTSAAVPPEPSMMDPATPAPPAEPPPDYSLQPPTPSVIVDPALDHASCLAASASMRTWHGRLGHVSTKRIRYLNKSGSALGLNINGSQPHDSRCSCETCMMTNNISHSVKKFRTFTDTVSRPGELITIDLMGPFPEDSEGHKYVFGCTDEFSRYSLVYLLKTKDEATNAVDSLAAFYNNLNIKIGKLRSDVGGEFGGSADRYSFQGGPGKIAPLDPKDFYTPAFEAVCAKHSIVTELMPAYKPQLHGVAERLNKTLMSMANSMLFQAKISTVLWGAAVAHANFLRNLLPCSSRGGHTPHELLTHKRPRYDTLRIWGCYCYKLLPNRTKIPGAAVRRRLIYVGESPGKVGFRCFDPITFKYSTEFELLFDEESVGRRSFLLEQFDNRRELHKQGKAESVPLVYESFPVDCPQRSVFTPSSHIQDGLEGHSSDVDDSTTTFADNNNVKGKSPTRIGLESGVEPSKQVRFDDLEAFIHFSPDDPPTQSPCNVEPRPGHHATDHSNKLKSIIKSPSTQSVSTSPRRSSPRLTTNNGTVCDSTEKTPLPSQSPSDDPPSDTDTASPCQSPRARSRSRLGKPTVRRTSSSCPPTRPPKNQTPTRSQSTCSGFGLSAVPTGVSLPGSDSLPSDHDLHFTSSSSGDNDLTNLLTGDDFNLVADTEADKHGPLLARNLEPVILHSSFDLDPVNPRCPVRSTPVGRMLRQPPEFTKFLRLAKSLNLPIAVQQHNPKQSDSMSYIRYEVSKSAKTFHQYFGLLAARGLLEPNGAKDFRNDFAHGYITFPLNTKAPTVPSVSVAASAISYRDSPSCDTPDEETAPTVDLHACTMRDSFHSTIKALWPHDPELSPAETLDRDVKAFAAVNELLGGSPDPTTYAAATHKDNPEHERWQAAIQLELDNLNRRGTWELVPRRSVKSHPIHCKWVFRKKFNKDDSIKYKGRLVACGYSQRAGLDYSSDELYASVCSYSSMRFLMSLATQKNFLLYQTDVQQAYLEASITEDIYMDVPKGMEQYDEHGNKLVCKLKRSLYGLKQAGYAWSQCFNEFMTSPKYGMGFTAMTGEPNLYRRIFELDGTTEEIFVGQYVDDCLLAVSSEKVLQWYLDNISKRFTVNQDSSGFISTESPGLLLSMHVNYDRDAGVLTFNQRKAIEALATKFNLNNKESHKSLPLSADDKLPKLDKAEDPKFITQFLSIIGSCLHLSQVSRPDISYAVGVLCRHGATPGAEHIQAALDLVGYLYHSRHWSIKYCRSNQPDANSPRVIERYYFPDSEQEAAKKAAAASSATSSPPVRSIEERLVASTPSVTPNAPITYIDANLGGDRVTRKSTSGLVITMNGGPICWSSRLQKLCAQSSAESEIYAVVDGVKEALHIKLLCEESGIREPGIPMEIWEDNQACIQMGHNLRGSNTAKHYELRLRFLNEQIWENNIQFSKIDTSDQLSDGFTKALNVTMFRAFRQQLLFNPLHPPSSP